MQKALKAIAVVVGLFLIGVVVVALLLIKALPSPWEIKQKLSPQKAQSPEFTQVDQEKTAASSPATTTAAAPKSHEEKVDDKKAQGWKVMKEDFMNPQVPFANVCANLPRAEQSHFLRADESGSANEFMNRLLDTNSKDPMVESASSLFRFLFRLGRFSELVDMIEKADMENDRGLLKKTEFYTKLGLAAQEVRSNKANIDRVLMKGYNLYVLSRAVGKRPELARDPATLNYCDQLEKNMNLNLEFNADEQAAELQKFLDDVKIDPKEVGFDPSYRSDVKFNFSQSSLQLNHIWIEKLFEKDIQRAREELNKAPSQAPEMSGS